MLYASVCEPCLNFDILLSNISCVTTCEGILVFYRLGLKEVVFALVVRLY